ncbi:hypothetical protein C8J57DRAFT_1240054 [Mycena rebaudengoi]|nr:hypothetical protein C8J57DRAFT_1240054 [Mycena rebaudengoi]
MLVHDALELAVRAHGLGEPPLVERVGVGLAERGGDDCGMSRCKQSRDVAASATFDVRASAGVALENKWGSEDGTNGGTRTKIANREDAGADQNTARRRVAKPPRQARRYRAKQPHTCRASAGWLARAVRATSDASTQHITLLAAATHSRRSIRGATWAMAAAHRRSHVSSQRGAPRTRVNEYRPRRLRVEPVLSTNGVPKLKRTNGDKTEEEWGETGGEGGNDMKRPTRK